MASLDLDALRSKRAEAHQETEPPSITVAGEQFVLPHEMPFEALENLVIGNVSGCLALVFGADGWRKFRQVAQPTANDIADLCDWLQERYQVGESQASPQS